MNFLEQLLGGSQRQEAEDFISRYNQGAPWEGYSDDEVASRYQQVASNISPEAYTDAAREAFERMSPQERMEFASYVQQHAQQQGMSIQDLNGDGIDDRLQDPRQLAQVTGRIQQQQPNFFSQLLGGLGGGGLGQVLSGGLGGGGLAQALGGGLLGGAGGRGQQSPMANPLVKGALAGIAALALGRMMNNQRR